MLRQLQRIAGAVIATCLVCLLAGCAGGGYPTLSGIKKIADSALSPSELQNAIDDMTLEQKKHHEASNDKSSAAQ